MARQRPWALNQYNRQAMEKRTNSEIDREYSRLSSQVNRRIQTFEKHNSMPSHVRSVKEVLNNKNISRREKESAIIEMKRFQNLGTSSYTSFMKARREALAVWVDMGIPRSQLNDEFFDFLEWARSFTGFNYNANAIKQAWETSGSRPSARNAESAKEIFARMQYEL